MPSFSHDWVVKGLVDKGAETSGFRRRVAEEIAKVDDADPTNAFAWMQSLPEKRPDAFVIDAENQVVTVHEVVKSSDFDPRVYADWWFFLDCEEWVLRVEVWSNHGARLGGYTEDDLCEIYYAAILDDLAEAKAS